MGIHKNYMIQCKNNIEDSLRRRWKMNNVSKEVRKLVIYDSNPGFTPSPRVYPSVKTSYHGVTCFSPEPITQSNSNPFLWRYLLRGWKSLLNCFLKGHNTKMAPCHRNVTISKCMYIYTYLSRGRIFINFQQGFTSLLSTNEGGGSPFTRLLTSYLHEPQPA